MTFITHPLAQAVMLIEDGGLAKIGAAVAKPGMQLVFRVVD
jgi:hypothetical protein